MFLLASFRWMIDQLSFEFGINLADRFYALLLP